MATKKAGGTVKNLRDSQPKYLGIKLADGSHAKPGSIIVRQGGNKILAGVNVGVGRDHTLFALKSGVVHFKDTKRIHFDRKTVSKKIVRVE